MIIRIIYIIIDINDFIMISIASRVTLAMIALIMIDIIDLIMIVIIDYYHDDQQVKEASGVTLANEDVFMATQFGEFIR